MFRMLAQLPALETAPVESYDASAMSNTSTTITYTLALTYLIPSQDPPRI